MKHSIESIRKPIESEMQAFEKHFRESMKSSVPLLDKITYYIVKRKGKQLRPMFVFLTAGMLGQINESTFRAASLIELLHTATLVHDDVVDDSFERRGFFSINALWKNKIAVLVGDYLLSRGLLLAIDHGEYQLLQIVSNSVREMSEGELLQIEKARRLDIDEKVYYEIIRQKTATLIAGCCATGAASVSASNDVVSTLRQIGQDIGMAFQIKDDLFDYETINKTGKPTGIDIQERKMTLPLIHTLQNVTESEKKKLINIIKNHNTDKKKVAEVLRYVSESGGIAYAESKMTEYVNKAINGLQGFDDNPFRQSLLALVNFTIQREA